MVCAVVSWNERIDIYFIDTKTIKANSMRYNKLLDEELLLEENKREACPNPG